MHVETLLLDLHLLWDRNNMEYIDISSIGICQVGSSSIRSFPFTSCKFSIKSNNRAWNKATNDKNSYYCDLTENFQFKNILERTRCNLTNNFIVVIGVRNVTFSAINLKPLYFFKISQKSIRTLILRTY